MVLREARAILWWCFWHGWWLDDDARVAEARQAIATVRARKSASASDKTYALQVEYRLRDAGK